MSTIVAVSKDGQTSVAWNSGTTVSTVAAPHAVPQAKVRRYGDALVGMTGFTVYLHLLNSYCVSNSPSDLKVEDDVFRYFLNFWKEMREKYHFVDDQCNNDEKSPFADLDSNFLVVNKSGIFFVREILSVSRYLQFCAMGSGASHAEGAVMALLESPLGAESLARRAVEIAIAFDRNSPGEIESILL